MAFTVRDLHDLIVLLEQHPDWKAELRRVLLGDELLRLPEIVRELVELVRGVIERQDRMEKRQERMEERQDRMERDLAELKGSDRERYYRERASAIFGRWLLKGRDATDLVAQRLQETVKAEQITKQEQDEVLDADLFWLGEYEGKEVLIVGEASWMVDSDDVHRAARRAEILRRLGLNAVGFAGGRKWTASAKKLAQKLQVVGSYNGVIDRALMERLLNKTS